MKHAAAALALLCGAAAAHAHDSWFAHDDGGALTIVTGTRYPRADLTAPPDSIAKRECSSRACWAEMREFEIELDPRIVELYFKEAKPDQAVRDRWNALHAKGIAWHERYRKFMRVELAPGADEKPAGLELEILPVGAKARFVLLSRNKPVANQPIELVSERNPLGLWSRTDANGEVEWQLPFAGEWLVRTIVIEPDGDTTWRSRFATLIFEAR